MSFASRVFLVLMLVPLSASAGSESTSSKLSSGTVLELSARVIDFGGSVEDLNPKVIDLKVNETKTEIRMDLPGDVLFDFDKAEILPRAEATLKQVADVIRGHPRSRVAIDGYTDAKGAEPYNLKLSQKRAQSVKTWMVTNAQIRENQLSTHGFGKMNPVAPNTSPDGSDNPDGRQQNRRVQITIKK